MVTCSICHDECVRMVRCSNGHACCVGCALCTNDARCPLCRESRPLVPDTTICSFLEACGTRLKCYACDVCFAPRDCERHRAWCPEHQFVCPYPNCSQCVPAIAMADHVMHHPSVPALTRSIDGSYHMVLAFQSRANECLIACVNDTTVVISNGLRRVVALGSQADPPMMVSMRAYYASGGAAPLRATVRQMSVSACDDAGGWLEEHRIGIVTPMMASREAVVSNGVTAMLAPRSFVLESQMDSHMIIPNARPGITTGLQERVCQAGIRDMPTNLPPLASLEPHTPTALVHVCFREDGRMSISDVYDA